MQNIRRDFIYGLIIVVFVASLIWLVDLSMVIVTGPISQITGIPLNTVSGMIVALLLIWLIGFSIRVVVARSIFKRFEQLFTRVPIIKWVYTSFRQISQLVFAKKKRFLATVFVEYPMQGTWALGFLTNESVTCLNSATGESILKQPVSVFIPSAPNPTNGVFVFVEESRIVMSNMTVEAGVKCVMSAGMITPPIKK